MTWRMLLACCALSLLFTGCSSGSLEDDIPPSSSDSLAPPVECPPEARDGGDETDGGLGGTGKVPEHCLE